MDKQTMGTVISAKKQWWFKVNTKAVRMHSFDGAVFPYIVTVEYTVNGTIYKKKKWISAGRPVPNVGDTVTLSYPEHKPAKAKILYQSI